MAHELKSMTVCERGPDVEAWQYLAELPWEAYEALHHSVTSIGNRVGDDWKPIGLMVKEASNVQAFLVSGDWIIRAAEEPYPLRRVRENTFAERYVLAIADTLPKGEDREDGLRAEQG